MFFAKMLRKSRSAYLKNSAYVDLFVVQIRYRRDTEYLTVLGQSIECFGRLPICSTYRLVLSVFLCFKQFKITAYAVRAVTQVVRYICNRFFKLPISAYVLPTLTASAR